ncbi:phospholipase D-like domain-containing protein [Pseudopedobacter saltans]|nr:phospholipase D-like domain-containing protein [Pseudopedobacter saltans]
MFLVVLCAVFTSVTVQAQEQILLGWQFRTSALGGTTVSGDSLTYTSTNHASGIKSSVLSRGAGFKEYNYANSFACTTKVILDTYQTSLAQNGYIEFTFQPKDDFASSLSTLKAKLRRSTNGGDATWYRWRYSINGGDFKDLSEDRSFTADNQGVIQSPVDLTGKEDLQLIAANSIVKFRLYVWGYTVGVGTGVFAVGRSSNNTDYGITIEGKVYDYNQVINSTIQQAYFTDQKKIAKGEASEVIINKLIYNINQTPAGEDIHMSIYMISHQGVLNALKVAEQRGVNLHMIVDMSRSDSQVANATSLPWLQANLPDSEIITCVNDVSSNAINHHKFVLFSKVLTQEGVLSNVTFQTSNNFTVSDTKKIQDALMFNSSGIYQAFLRNWNTIKTYATSGMSSGFVYNTFNENDVKLAFFPKRGTGVNTNEDDVVESLNAISNVSASKIRIAMSDWSDSRPAIIDKLIQLRNQGANIEVFAKDAAGTQTKVKLRQLQALGATVRIFNLEEGAAAKLNIHAKMMLIEGDWNGKINAKVIITGSHNYTDGALKTNNEVLVTLTNSTLFSEYSQYFEEIKKIVPVVPVFQLDLKSIDLTSGNNSNVATFNSTASVGGVVNAFVSRGAGLKGNTGLPEGYSSSHQYVYTAETKSTFANAFDRDEYLQIQFETKNAVKSSLNRIEWIIRKSAATAATHYRWYYSINSAEKSDFKPINAVDQAFVHDATAAVQPEINLSEIPELQSIGSNTKIYFRLYIIGGINTSSTFAFRNLNGIPGFNLFGDVDNDLTESLLGWGLSTSNNGSRAEGNEVAITSNITHANIKPSSLKRGSGLNANPEYNVTLQRGFTAVSSNVVTTLEEAENYGNYFTFDISPKANVALSLKALHANLRRSSAGGNKYLWRYKINDGEFVDLTSEVTFTSTNTNGVYQPVVDLAGITALQNVKADSIVFRLYVWGFNTANSGTFAIGRSADSYDLALQIQGTSTITNPLPVTLAAFEASKLNNTVKLRWTTASEQNNSHFDVLKSSDGKDWSLLTTISGAGNSSTKIDYQYMDNNPFVGMNYYQLKQIDFDGKSTPSKVLNINFDNLKVVSGISVNYLNEKLTVFTNDRVFNNRILQVYNINGQLITIKDVSKMNGDIVLPISLTPGIYILSISSDNGISTTKFKAN